MGIASVEKRLRDGYRNIVWLGTVSFFTDLSTEMILGILPLFIIKELGGTRALLGIIEGIGEALGYSIRTVSGVISDQVGKRKTFVLLGYGLSTISKPFFALSRIWSDILVIRAGDRFGKGLRTAPRDALISESVGEDKMGKAFGLHRSLDQAGAIVGPALAFIFIPFFGARGIFWLSFLPALVALIILTIFVKEVSIQPKKSEILQNLKDVFQGRFLILLIVLMIFSIGAFNFSFILLKASDLGVEENFIPIIYAVINVAHTAVGIPSGALADRIGKERVLAIGFGFLFTSSLLSYLSEKGYQYAYLIALVYGVYMGINETVQRAIIPKYAPSNLRATAFGIYNLLLSVSLLIANFTFGSLSELFGTTVAFSYSMTTSLIAILAIILFNQFYVVKSR